MQVNNLFIHRNPFSAQRVNPEPTQSSGPLRFCMQVSFSQARGGSLVKSMSVSARCFANGPYPSWADEQHDSWSYGNCCRNLPGFLIRVAVGRNRQPNNNTRPPPM